MRAEDCAAEFAASPAPYLISLSLKSGVGDDGRAATIYTYHDYILSLRYENS